ncbi:MAG: TolC family protein [Fretibacterium sp.]|nr:TolC family protein [Fretibacterium sp.]
MALLSIVLAFLLFGISWAAEKSIVTEMGTVESFGDVRLSEILEIASRGNPNIAAAKEKVAQAREDARSAAAAMGPNINVGASARYETDRNVFNASLNLIQTLYAGGSVRANYRAAKLALSAVESESSRTYQEVLNEVRVRYYDCLRAGAKVRVAEEALQLAEEHKRHARKLFGQGMIPKGDVLRVEVSLNQSELELVSARSDFEVSWSALEHAVGSKLVQGGILDFSGAEDELPSPDRFEFGEVVDAALAQRPELRAYRFYGERAAQLVKAASGQRRPRVTLSGRLNSDRDDRSWADDRWYVQIEAQWALYDGGEGASAVRKAKAAARELLYVLENLSSQVRQEAVQAEIRLRSARERFELAKKQVATSQEDYRMAFRRYEARLGSNIDVLDAKRALVRSRTEYVDAVYDAAAARSHLVYVMGGDLPPDSFFLKR